MKRVLLSLLLFSVYLLPTLAIAQTSFECSSKNINPVVPDILQQDGKEHQFGVVNGHAGTTATVAGSALSGACSYANPMSGTTCQTTCTVQFNGIPPTITDTQNLIVPGKHNVTGSTASNPSVSGAGQVSCTASFGITALNINTDASTGKTTTTTVYSPALTTTTLTCPAVQIPTPTPAPSPTPAPTPVPTPIFTPTPSPSPTPACLVNCPVGGKPGQPCDNDPTGGGTGGDKPDLASGCSPIIIDTMAEGFHLTSASRGVLFDISGSGTPIQVAWTDVGYRNAFLVLPGLDGLVHDGTQLFGNFTPQPDSPHPNGFLALAEYDMPENGGNGDGVIDEKDAVFSRLRLWIDENHDGICQSTEMHELPEEGVYSLALGYFDSGRKDEFGNQFRYKARINPGIHRDKRDQTSTGDPGRWAYDVFFVSN